MNLARYLKEERVDLELDAAFPLPDDEEQAHPATVESVTEHMCDLLTRSEAIVNETKLRLDLVNRERRTASLLGNGLFLPHVRTLQARRLVMAVGVSAAGLPLGAEDGEPVRLVIALVGPTYDDKAYLQVYKRLSEKLSDEDSVNAVLQAERAGEVVRALSG